MAHQPSMLVVSAHAADFVWRAGGAIALYANKGYRVRVICLSYGERGESARLWKKEGATLESIKEARRQEAIRAAEILGADIHFLDAGDYPLKVTDDLIDAVVGEFREYQPDFVLTHAMADPYNFDHPAAAEITLKCRVYAQALGYPASGNVIGAPPVFLFEPHQPEQCDFKVDLLLDITPVFERKKEAMESMGAQEHLVQYYLDLARRRGVQAKRNSGPNIGLKTEAYAEAYQRLYPQVTTEFS
ncbi:MAG: PIG-L family deacetylase [Deltaproteobacteria bacterium]|nr:PIG-L family deacetylase [Deltaproteobacteria bacterium]MBW1961070.1 PIG-L family deacetylase [Deltaproteobacteria bacterium]MBW2150513.1 PIG-L family deacetylase [Deltaproteobacteria bacterium]